MKPSVSQPQVSTQTAPPTKEPEPAALSFRDFLGSCAPKAEDLNPSMTRSPREDVVGIKISENNRGEVWVATTIFLAQKPGESAEELASRTVRFSAARHRETYEAVMASIKEGQPS